MNATTDRAALLQGLAIYDEIASSVDERTLEILNWRRRNATVHHRGRLVRRVLLAADLIGLIAAMALSEWIVTAHSSAGVVDARAEIALFLATLPGWVVMAKLYGLYDRDEERTDHSTADDFSGVFHMVTVCTFFLWAWASLTHLAHPTTSKLLLFWIAAITAVSTARAFARAGARRRVSYLQNTVIVGAGDVGQSIARKLLRHAEYGINLVGFVDAAPKERGEGLGHLAMLGGPERLSAVIRLFDIERVIVAFSNESHTETLDLVTSLKDLDVQIDIVPRLFETVGPRASIHTLEGIPLVGLPPLRLAWSSLLLKRTLDICVSIVMLVLLAPVFVVVALLVRLDSAGPVIHCDERIGRKGEIFRAFKFRTMRLDAAPALERILESGEARREFERVHKLSQDPRVTRIGRVLRRTSLDELPQLVNVLGGAVSLVGARPITRYEYERLFKRRGGAGTSGYWEFDLRPGLTGYWQINGRSSMDYEDRVRLDLAYLTSWSLRLDLTILAKTARVLATRRGAV